MTQLKDRDVYSNRKYITDSDGKVITIPEQFKSYVYVYQEKEPGVGGYLGTGVVLVTDTGQCAVGVALCSPLDWEEYLGAKGKGKKKIYREGKTKAYGRAVGNLLRGNFETAKIKDVSDSDMRDKAAMWVAREAVDLKRANQLMLKASWGQRRNNNGDKVVVQ